MRVLAPLLTIIASVTTIFAAVVRMSWSKPQPTPQDYRPDDPPKAPRWLRVASKWWLIFVAGFVGVGFLMFVIITVIQLST